MNTKIKANLRRLQALSRIAPDELPLFYEVSFSDYRIDLQGRYNQEIVKFAVKHKFRFNDMTEGGFIYLKRGNINIILH
jgi:hypothetical protein